MSAAAARTNWAFPEPRRPSGSTGVSSRPVRISLPHPSARGLTAHRRDAVAVGTCSRGRPSRPVRHRSLPRAERRRRVGGRAARSARARSALRDRGGDGLRVRGGQEPVLDPDPTPDQQLAEPDDAGSPWFAVTSSGSCSSRPPAPVVGGDPGRLPPSAQRDGNAEACRAHRPQRCGGRLGRERLVDVAGRRCRRRGRAHRREIHRRRAARTRPLVAQRRNVRCVVSHGRLIPSPCRRASSARAAPDAASRQGVASAWQRHSSPRSCSHRGSNRFLLP
jgi:hypothetical protein